MLSRWLVALLLCPLGLAAQTAQTPAEQARMDEQNAHLRALVGQSARLPLEPRALAVKPPDTPAWAMGMVSWVASAADGTVYLLQRGDKADPVIAIDQEGHVVRSWGRGMFTTPHAIRVDPQGNIWTTDAASSMVYKFSRDRRVMLVFSECMREHRAGTEDNPAHNRRKNIRL